MTLRLVAMSAAQDAGFVALADCSELMSDETLRPSRIIGGQMLEILLAHHRIQLARETRDADLGLNPVALRSPAIVERLHELGYAKTAGNRFERALPEISVADPSRPARAAIDLLVPAYTSRARASVSFGDPPHLDTTEVFGLAFAFKRPALEIELELQRLSGEHLRASLELPDEPSAVMLKGGAWQARAERRDAVDVHRALRVAQAASTVPSDFQDSAIDAQRAVLLSDFGVPGGDGLRAMAAGLTDEAAERVTTETRALVHRLLG